MTGHVRLSSRLTSTYRTLSVGMWLVVGLLLARRDFGAGATGTAVVALAWLVGLVVVVAAVARLRDV